ncbi:NSP-interacting kinase 1-like protein [Tanacetum coccineum]
MVTELSDAFLYAQSAYELWKEIAERYRQSNGPLIYQLERELSKISQGSLTIDSYFNKLKKCWDELQNINGLPTCDCGKLREFRSQILAMDPLPTVNKAYYIVQQIEKQKQVTSHTFEPTAFFANMNNKGQSGGRKEVKGYPNWYKGKKAKKQGRIAAYVNLGFDEYFSRESHFDMGNENEDLSTNQIVVVGKGSRLPFPKSDNIAPTPFHLIHVDLWGPYKHAALNGAHYFLTIKDDNTRATWTYLVHSKEQLKVRLVVRGFNQKEGLNYKNTISPVAKLAAVRVIVALATAKEWPLHQLDVNNAFLHGYIDEEIYMLPPEVYHKDLPEQVCKLNRSLHGLKQASKKWNHELTKFMATLGNSSSEILNLKASLDHKFTIKYLGPKPATFPLPTQLKLSLDKGTPLSDESSYRKLVGRLLYLTMTRPDISYAVQHLSQFVSAPKDVHMQAATHLLKSSTEAEYKSIAATTCELIWLTFLLKDLHIEVKLPITLFCDNKSAQQLAANPCFHDRTKHLAIDCHFTRDKVQDGFLQTAFSPTHLQLADIMTKTLGQEQYSFLANKLGLSEAPT